MEVFTPDYFEKFHCIASACPDSCCKEWEVDVDAQAAAFYRDLPGDLGDRLRQVLKDTEDGTVMTIENGRCPMWRQDGLCRIQAELGHGALCKTCREFPRLTHDYGDFVERGLELSCPEAARLILSSPQIYSCEAVPGGEAAEYDENIMDILLRSRQEVLSFLAQTQLPLNHALAVVLLYAHEVQAALDGGEYVSLDASACLTLAMNHADSPDWHAFLDFFKGLEILTPQWPSRLDAPRSPSPWNETYLALAKYGIWRYWLQAVSDFDLVSRVKFIISMCLLVNRLGGDTIQTAQLFSKEIENDADNVEAILDGAYCSPAFTDVNLLSLLLEE